MMNKTIIASLSLVTALTAVPAIASADSSSAEAMASAIRSGNEDAIVAELEHAERTLCGSLCIDRVMALIDHDSYYVREAAAWWITRRRAQQKRLAAQAIEWLANGTSREARNGADALGTFGYGEFIPALEAAVVRTALDAEARAHAVRALGRIANAVANDTLAVAMQDEAAEVRFEAVQAWRSMLLQTDAAPVTQLVADPDVEVRRSAIAAVGKFREASARADLEAQLLESPDAPTRRNAAWALGQIGDAASRAALTAATADESPLVRMTARTALRQLR